MTRTSDAEATGVRLSEIEALTTNASLVITTATSPKDPWFFGEQWEALAAQRAVVQQLPRFHYIAFPR